MSAVGTPFLPLSGNVDGAAPSPITVSLRPPRTRRRSSISLAVMDCRTGARLILLSRRTFSVSNEACGVGANGEKGAAGGRRSWRARKPGWRGGVCDTCTLSREPACLSLPTSPYSATTPAGAQIPRSLELTSRALRSALASLSLPRRNVSSWAAESAMFVGAWSEWVRGAVTRAGSGGAGARTAQRSSSGAAGACGKVSAARRARGRCNGGARGTGGGKTSWRARATTRETAGAREKRK